MREPAPWNPTPETLLSEHAWARRLARRLLHEEAAAEDVAQEACLRALEVAPRSSPRGWLAGIVRNLARQTRREQGRRERREAMAARPEAEPSASAALERLSVQQDVVRAVLALREPYRSTIVQRFYEDLPPRKIAARQGVPVATVKTRLTRGLAELRARLDREHGSQHGGGDGRALALFLAPLAARPQGALPLLPELTMGALIKTGLASVAAIGLVLWLAREEGAPGKAPRIGVQPSVAKPRVEPAEEGAGPALDARQALAASTPSSPTAPEAFTLTPETIQGRVLDLAGAPVAGVALTLRESHGSRMDKDGGERIWSSGLDPELPPLATSDAQGGFEIELPVEFSGAVVSQDERFETVLAPDAYPSPGYEPVVLVASCFRLSGRVTDAQGTPLSGVGLRFDLPEDLMRTIDADLTDTMAVGWSMRTDAQGRFAMARLPAVPGAHLLVRLAPFADQRIARAQWLDEELEIVLREPDGAWIEGVVEAGGAPKPGATVALGQRAVSSGASGEFRLPIEGLEREGELCALAPDLLPTRMRGDAEADGTFRWPSFVRLELTGEPLALEGRVTDVEGTPLPEQEVWLTDATVSHQATEGFPVLLEGLLAGKTELRHGAKTDAKGRFRITGLEEREYHLQVIDPRTALLVEAGPFAAGRSDLEIRYPGGALFPLVRGTVRTRDGAPLGGQFVYVDRYAAMVGVGDRHFGFQASGARARTDENGAFELLDVPRSGVVLHVSGDGVLDPQLEIGPGIDPLDLELEVGVWVSLQVAAGGPLARADRFYCLDANGAALQVAAPMEGGTSLYLENPLVHGRSPVVRVGDDAHTLVLYAGSEELARVPLVLRTGELNRVDL